MNRGVLIVLVVFLIACNSGGGGGGSSYTTETGTGWTPGTKTPAATISDTINAYENIAFGCATTTISPSAPEAVHNAIESAGITLNGNPTPEETQDVMNTLDKVNLAIANGLVTPRKDRPLTAIQFNAVDPPDEGKCGGTGFWTSFTGSGGRCAAPTPGVSYLKPGQGGKELVSDMLGNTGVLEAGSNFNPTNRRNQRQQLVNQILALTP